MEKHARHVSPICFIGRKAIFKHALGPHKRERQDLVMGEKHSGADYLKIGVITTTHGVRGEVKVYPTTDDPARFKRLKEVILDTGREKLTLEIESVKFFKQLVILKFKGLDDIDKVQKFRQGSLYVTRANAVRLSKDEYFIADLIGLKVIDEEEQPVGILKDVMETGANDVYVIEMYDGRELLLPAIKQCILRVDIEGGLLQAHILEGLLD